MADLFLEGPVFELQPVPVDVEIHFPDSPESEPSPSPHGQASPPGQASPYGDYLDERLLSTTVPDPIRLRGVGGTTLFGLSNRFSDDYPSALAGRVAPEEFHGTLSRVNSVLAKSIPLNLRCLLCGCLCCCCTLGLSLGPVVYLSKRTMSRIEKLLDSENWRLYHKLGLNLRLSREQCENTNLREYMILLEFLPKLPLYRPD